jgi:predicted O-methyltransferase YrrM
MLLAEIEKLEGGRILDPETGFILPWYTSPCLEWLTSIITKAKHVFEYGVGDSTKWFIEKGAYVTGVDDDSNWSSQGGVYIRLATEKKEYLESIYHYRGKDIGFKKFDMVIIDGIYRDECTQHALACLKPGGYLIIDNYHQPSVEPNVWTQTDKLIEGMPITIYKEPTHEDWQTAVITKL